MEIERFRTAIHGRLGLRFDDGKLDFLAEVLVRRLEATGQPPTSYVGELEGPGAPEPELRALARELTVTETYFFRNAEQFRALTEAALPDRMRADPGRRPLRILSAGCASGEEAYTLAILARSPELVGCPLSICGVDVNPAMLERAARARYTSWALRETPSDIQGRYFRADGRELVLDEDVRRRVTFEERNLVVDDPTFWRPSAFDVIFCRNVLMYFAPETAQAVVARLTRSLVPGGFVFLGYAETMRGLSQDFHLRHTHGTFYYQRRDATGGAFGEVDEVLADAPRWTSFVSGPPAPRSREDIPSAAPDPSWMEIIRHSSERIASITSQATPGRTRGDELDAKQAPRRRPSFDLTFTVDLMRQERFGEAAATLERLPPESAQDTDVLLLRAVLLTHGGDLAATETLCEQILALDQMSAGAHYLTALCREDARDRLGAADHDRVAAHVDPTFAMPRLHLGLLARRAGDYDAARRELVEALALLAREDDARLLLFGGGFGRQGLIALCQAELRSCGGTP